MNLKTETGVRALIVRTLVLFMAGFLGLAGCSHPRLSTTKQILEFEQAGPIKPRVDVSRLIRAKIAHYPYTVVAGDVLQLHMPTVLQTVVDSGISAGGSTVQQYLCRVSDAGKITLPIIGEISVKGMNLAEIEDAIVRQYYPRYITERPSVIVQVAQYHTQSVSITGAVNQPGTYALRSDELSLVSLLMKAGGITGNNSNIANVSYGAKEIIIRHRGKLSSDPNSVKPIILPVKGTNIPFEDVALRQGDIVEVEPLNPEVFTVIGLVNKPGAFPYPPGCSYNIMQALAFAGGLNDTADPHYVRVYRQKADGSIIDATFPIERAGITGASGIRIKPGDVVAVEQTTRTRTRIILSQIVRFGLGFNMVYRLDNNNYN